MVNLSKLFYAALGGKTYYNNIALPSEMEEALKAAKREIQARLKKDVGEFTSKILEGKKIVPRFWPQGSWAYKTLISPCYETQEADLDLGVYLPMSFHERMPPAAAAREFFDVVESSLSALASKNKGWFIPEKMKTSCCRINIAKNMHVDIPLYAVPDEEFTKLLAVAQKRGLFDAEHSVLREDAYQTEDLWNYIDEDLVHLAKRDGTWEQSDPMKIHRWVNARYSAHGEGFRRQIQFLKGWRDLQWEEGGPTSLFLMFWLDLVYDSSESREDKRLLKSLQKMNSVFERVQNPTLQPPKDLAAEISPDLKHQIFEKVAAFAERLERAIDEDRDSGNSCDLVRGCLGTRFPRVENLPLETKRDIVLAAAPAVHTNVSIPRRTSAG